MSTPLTIKSVCDRVFKDAASLTQPERFLYLLANFESWKDMEGWDFFYLSYNFPYYHDLIAGLEASGDAVSLEILRDYEQHFFKWGVAFEQEAIRSFLADPLESYLSSCRDWEREFEDSKEIRWQKVEAYLKRCGYEVVG